MEQSIYQLFTFFTTATYILSHTIYVRDGKILKLISGASLLFLGLSTLSIEYIIPNNLDYAYVTHMADTYKWQLSLCFIYSMFGIFNILLAMHDLLIERKNEVA